MNYKLFFSLIAMALAGCQQQNNEIDTPPAELETITVSKSDVTLYKNYPAQIEGRQRVKLIPRVEGYLQEIRVNEGQHVTKNQVLFVVDQSTYRAEAKASEANVALAEANVETAQLNYDSRLTLHQKNIISDYELRTAASNLSVAKAQLAQALAQLESARANLSYTELRSPCDGVVGSLPFRIGDLVGPNIQEGLTTVADIKEMYVYFSITEREIMKFVAQYGSIDKTIAMFPPVSLITANGDTCKSQGRIESISGVVESNTGAVSARAVFDNSEGGLLSGSTGSVLIKETIRQTLVIPQSATYEIQDKTFCWRVIDGKAQSAIIEVTPTTDGQHYIVTQGLAVGDEIVATGAGYVKEGQEVKLTE